MATLPAWEVPVRQRGIRERRLTSKGHLWTQEAIVGRDRFHLRMVALGLRPEHRPTHRRDESFEVAS